MQLRQTVEEFQDVNAELAKLRNLKKLQTILKLILVGFLIGRGVDGRVSELTKKRTLILGNINEQCMQSLENLNRRIEEIESRCTYLICSDKKQCIATIDALESDFTYLDENRILKPESVSAMKEELRKIHQVISDYNRKFVEQRKRKYSHLWKKGFLSLDEEQQRAIVTDDKYNLVVAAAGSGKTEVLITRISYLIARKPDGVLPSRILAIAYQNKDVKHILRRLHDSHVKKGVNVRTFHKLGLDILQSSSKISNLSILDRNERPRLIRKIYEEKLNTDPDFQSAFFRYAKSLHETKIEENMRNKEETLELKKTLPYTGIDNTHVKSRAEKEILDFFLTTKLNGLSVQIIYEPEIEGLGRPDFHLPEYNLFIENWGLNENGQVPQWFDQSTEDYKKNMERKRLWFAKNDKLLVETYAYEYDENNPEEFIELLEEKVIEKLQARYNRSFEFTPITYEEVLQVASAPDRDKISRIRISKDIFNFIKNAKTYNITPAEIMWKLNHGNWSPKQYTFGNLAIKVYESYEEELRKLEKIDFEDMINKANKELIDNKDLYAKVYDHILIDEYQDISAQRYNLIKNLLAHNPECKLFCVGDDWQSIMGFAGSNLEFFVNFEKYFKNPAITKICTNYRSIGSIVEAGRDLMKNNGTCQIPKNTVSNHQKENIIKVFKSPHKRNYKTRYHEQIVTDCLDRLIEYRRKGYAPEDILILSRFMRTHTNQAPRFHDVIRRLIKKAQNMGIEIAPDNAKARNRIRLLTVHKSKGLEAKVVFILNVIEDLYGFPCEIEDPEIYAPARENYPPQDHKEEERRLFYVALTRAKEDLIIYTWEPVKSGFIEEINRYIEENPLHY